MHTKETQNPPDFLTSYPCSSDKFIDLLNWGVVKISGDKAEGFLQGQFTNDVTKVNSTQGALSALCNHQGRVLAVFYLLKKEEDYYCLLPNSLTQDVIQYLAKFAVFSKVKLEDLTGNVFLYACVGKDAVHLLTQKYKEIPTKTYQTIEDRTSLIMNATNTLPKFLILRHEPFADDEVVVDDSLWKLTNILSGQANIYLETRGIVTPHMLNLHQLDAVSFNKGCYVGQEIIARTHYLGKSKRHLCRGKLSADIDLLPGEIIYANEQEVGVLIESVIINGKTLILAVIQEPIDREFNLQEISIVELERV